ncbi:MAG: acyl carrier protein [Phycisphaerae bacterium]|nr:acyl carrier protein [Phycisphaerae bacterium]MDW8263577.1 acyl carrier protein [Phycisphaerales bacterium]
MTHEEIYNKVKAVLVDALGVDDEEVKPESVLKDDLGAESIDFLDIMFRLEKAFNIKIPRGELIPENLATDPNLVKDGIVQPAAIAMMKEKMPYNDFSEFEKDPRLDNMSKLFTVEAITKYIEYKLSQPPSADAPPSVPPAGPQ